MNKVDKTCVAIYFSILFLVVGAAIVAAFYDELFYAIQIGWVKL